MIRLKWGVTKIGDLGDVSWIVGYSGAIFVMLMVFVIEPNWL